MVKINIDDQPALDVGDRVERVEPLRETIFPERGTVCARFVSFDRGVFYRVRWDTITLLLRTVEFDTVREDEIFRTTYDSGDEVTRADGVTLRPGLSVHAETTTMPGSSNTLVGVVLGFTGGLGVPVRVEIQTPGGVYLATPEAVTVVPDDSFTISANEQDITDSVSSVTFSAPTESAFRLVVHPNHDGRPLDTTGSIICTRCFTVISLPMVGTTPAGAAPCTHPGADR